MDGDIVADVTNYYDITLGLTISEIFQIHSLIFKKILVVMLSVYVVINLVFWYQKRLLGKVPSTWNWHLKWPTPFEKRQIQPISAYSVWTVRGNENANRKSTTCFPTSDRWSECITPNSRKGASISEFVVFAKKIKVQLNKVYYEVSLFLY